MTEKEFTFVDITICFIIIAILYAKMVLIYRYIELEKFERIKIDMKRLNELKNELNLHLK